MYILNPDLKIVDPGKLENVQDASYRVWRQFAHPETCNL